MHRLVPASGSLRIPGHATLEVSCLTELASDLANERILVRERAGFQFGIDQLVADRQFKTSTAGRFEFESSDFLFVCRE